MVKILKRESNFNEIIIAFLFLYIGTVYFSVALANILFGIACIIFLLGIILKKIKLNFNKHQWMLYFLVVMPFTLTLLSVLLTENPTNGFNHLWMRAPILICPFILLFMNVETKHIKIGFSILVACTIIASFITVRNAIQYFDEDILFVPDFTFFITIIQHPYFGVYVLITLFSIVEFDLIKMKPLKFVVFLLLTMAIVLTTSRIVYVLFFVIVSTYLLEKFSKKKALFFVILISLLAITFVVTNKGIMKKFQAVTQYQNSTRLKLWNNSIKVVNTSESLLFGIGIGDFFKPNKDVYFFEESKDGTLGYNPHSQFVEFFVTNGIFGLIVLFITMIYVFKKILKQKKIAIIIFGIIFVFSLTESIFSRQFGVELYSIFIPLVLRDNLKKRDNEIL